MCGASGALEGRESGNEDEPPPCVVNEMLRQYELDRLKYYFGVVTCDGVATAEAVYAECDGAEFESSSLALDLRFIPDGMAFPKPHRERVTQLPPKYKAPSFMCSALQQSKPKLSWDADDSERAKVGQPPRGSGTESSPPLRTADRRTASPPHHRPQFFGRGANVLPSR